MCKADITIGIDDTIQRHAPQLKEIHFLPVGSRHRMVRVRQADERDSFPRPVLLKARKRIGTHSQNFGAAMLELFISIPEARQLRTAIRSHKAAQKRKHDRLAAKIR